MPAVRLLACREDARSVGLVPDGVLVMSEALLGAAVQGGIGVVALVVLVVINNNLTKSLRTDMRALEKALVDVAYRLGQLIGRDDPTPVRTAKEDHLRRRAARVAATSNENGHDD